MSERPASIERFLSAHGWDPRTLAPLAGDASFRRYSRLAEGDRRAILMDAPPSAEDVRPFLAVGAWLRRRGFSAPAVLAADEAEGLLLLEDFGDATFTRLLHDGADEAELYALAVDVLVHLHEQPEREFLDCGFPRYDDAKFIAEACLYPDWYLPHSLGRVLDPEERQAYVEAWRSALGPVSDARPVLVLRDFHVDNLMRLDTRHGIASCGILDFQDAVVGPAAYDLVSLLEDARRDVPGPIRCRMLERYVGGTVAHGRGNFAPAYSILAAQRHAKVLGIFTRLYLRDGKPGYLKHLPRVQRLLNAALLEPGLEPVAEWIRKHVPAPLGESRSAA